MEFYWTLYVVIELISVDAPERDYLPIASFTDRGVCESAIKHRDPVDEEITFRQVSIRCLKRDDAVVHLNTLPAVQK